MTDRAENQDLENELRELLDKVIFGSIHADEFQRLQDRLKSDPAARQLYLAELEIESLLQGVRSDRQPLVFSLDSDPSAQQKFMSDVEFESQREETISDETLNSPAEKDCTPSLGPGNVAGGLGRNYGLSYTTIVVTVLATACLFSFLLIQFRPNPATEIGTVNIGDPVQGSRSQMLVSVEPIADGCRWYVEQADRKTAASYQSGDVIRVSDGDLELMYANGTKVVLRSPAAYQLISSSSARMIIGRLTAVVAEAGKGFTIVTPQADVIDLGTEFGVEVNDDGATDVVVFKGEVDLDYYGRKTQAQRLRMGEAVRLDAIGTTSRLVWINGESYSNKSLKPSGRHPLIVEVRDNLERDPSMLNFYEIVTAGVKEDALAYVDRIAHQYNGITKEGMPSYLLNADYVKMFNNDKFNKTTQVEVTLSMPAKLYILLDNRHEPPQWLTEEFNDTGDDIGLDNGPFQTGSKKWHNKGPSGVGAGESVDDEMSIWVKEVSPGVVQLGPMGTTTEVGANMYGIMAKPIETLPRDDD